MAKEQAQRKRRKRYIFEKVLTRSVFDTLVRRQGESDGRVPRAQIVKILNEKSGADQKKAFNEYVVGKHWPTGRSLWDIGEALHEWGVPWASGLWLAWACGRYADVISVLAVWAHEREGRIVPGECSIIYNVLAAARPLADSTLCDRVEPLSSLHIQKSFYDDETALAFATFVGSINPKSKYFLIEMSTFLAREMAKAGTLKYDIVRPGLNAAIASWREEKTPYGKGEVGELLESLIRMAGAGGPVESQRERTILATTGHWLKCIQHGGKNLVLPSLLD